MTHTLRYIAPHYPEFVPVHANQLATMSHCHKNADCVLHRDTLAMPSPRYTSNCVGNAATYGTIHVHDYQNICEHNAKQPTHRACDVTTIHRLRIRRIGCPAFAIIRGCADRRPIRFKHNLPQSLPIQLNHKHPIPQCAGVRSTSSCRAIVHFATGSVNPVNIACTCPE